MGHDGSVMYLIQAPIFSRVVKGELDRSPVTSRYYVPSKDWGRRETGNWTYAVDLSRRAEAGAERKGEKTIELGRSGCLLMGFTYMQGQCQQGSARMVT